MAQDPKILSGQLRRIAPNLRAVGVSITFTKPDKQRLITLAREPSFCVGTVGCGVTSLKAAFQPDANTGYSDAGGIVSDATSDAG